MEMAFERNVRMGKLFPSVDKILINLLGENWRETDELEQYALLKATEFKTFYEKIKEHQLKFQSLKQKMKNQKKVYQDGFVT